METKGCAICEKCRLETWHEDDLKCFRNEIGDAVKIQSTIQLIDEAIPKTEIKAEKIARIGTEFLYNYLNSIQRKQICRGWAVGKGYLYHHRLYADDYGIDYDHYNAFHYAVSSMTAYPCLIEVETTTVHELEGRTLYINADLHSDIHALVYYNESAHVLLLLEKRGCAMENDESE